MTEEYIVEEEPTRRPFFLAVATLLTIFILAALCSLIFLLPGRGTGVDPDEVAAIETQNAIIAVTNTAVAEAIAATETAQAMPTNTPLPTVIPTDTPTPVPDTPVPTETPVVELEGTAIATPENGETGVGDGTVIPATVEGEGVPGIITTPATPTTPTPIPVIADADGKLPQTGIDTWSALVLGLILVVTFVVARRLRTA